MAETCFVCKKGLSEHDAGQSAKCISKMSDLLTTHQTRIQSELREMSDDEALEQFSNTKLGEPSRMGSK